jgi:hypothetical protein
MSLYNVEGSLITSTPHKDKYDLIRGRITQDQEDAIIEEIHKKINDVEIFSASFLPGSDWTGTPFQCIYEACGQDQQEAGYAYGIFCWIAVQRHGEKWICYKSEEPNKQLGLGWTYFKMTPRPLKF